MRDGGPTTAARTAVLTKPPDGSEGSSEAEPATAPDDRDPTEPVPAPRRRGRFWRVAVPVLAVLCLVGVVALAWYGKEAVLDSSSGLTLSVIDDPSAPGYEVLVSATETMLLVQTDEDGTLVGVTFLSLPNESTGAALFIPPDAVVDDPILGPVSIAELYSGSGAAGVTAAVEKILGVGIADFGADYVLQEGQVEEIDADRLESLVAPVAPLTVDNLDTVTVTGGDGEVIATFPTGELSLEASDVGLYLAARNEGENDLNRLARHEAFWTAWIEAIRADGSAAAIAGETGSGIGRFLSLFANGETVLEVTPATTFGVPGAEGDLYLVEDDLLAPWVASVVPFPVGPTPGERTTLRVLDGTGTDGAALAASRELVKVGGEIRVMGNGPTFDYGGSHILYHAPEHEQRARDIAKALGGGTVELRERPDEVVMVTVILGAEQVEDLELGS